MFAEERHLQILTILERQGRVRVVELARELQVTEETVRRDLERLDQDGRLQRTHGGALPGSARRELPFAQRQASQLAAKTAIAHAALALVVPGQVIALDGSTSAFAMASSLPEGVALTVVTTSLPVVGALADREDVRVVCSGGTFDPTSRSFLGPIAAEALARINIHTLFLSCIGVDLERGVSESTDDLAAVKRRLIERAERVVLLVDNSKFGVRGAISFATLADIDVVITDRPVEPATAAALAAQGGRVVLADVPPS
jgi:DeoR/GlpR family transcriptional regulator of sugar metabolism